MYTQAPTQMEGMATALIRHTRAARRRRRLVRRLRRLAAATPARDPLRRRADPWLHERLAAVRVDLSELADALERAVTADPRVLRELQTLVADGCASPLLNPELHVSELYATLYWVRSRLDTSPSPPSVRRSARGSGPSTRPSSPWGAPPGSDTRFLRR
jgi:hypothetical protein